jgi:hypothetical protein
MTLAGGGAAAGRPECSAREPDGRAHDQGMGVIRVAIG